MIYATTDLCDEYGDAVRVVEGNWQNFGSRKHFSGVIATVRLFEDNTLLRAMLEEDGEQRVLVVDGGGSLRCALMGDQMAGLALERGWAGLIVHGAVRDAEALAHMDLGVEALGLNPRRSAKGGGGERQVPVEFAGVRFAPGQWLAADRDGIVVLDAEPKPERRLE